MSGAKQVPGQAANSAVTVSFGQAYASSAAFDAIYREGMALVEETATYLDGAGRSDAKSLKAPLNMAYATESMRLTTRLMQLASWLLIRKALNEGEMSLEDADEQRRKVRLNAVGRPSHNRDFEALPQRLKELVEHSYALYDRILKLDRMVGEAAAPASPEPAPASNVLDLQRARLEAAFSGHGSLRSRSMR
jgi:regulator of CtrA degradation